MSSYSITKAKSMVSEHEAGQEGPALTSLKNGVMWKSERLLQTQKKCKRQ